MPCCHFLIITVLCCSEDKGYKDQPQESAKSGK
jgi:hypothetical protein